MTHDPQPQPTWIDDNTFTITQRHIPPTPELTTHPYIYDETLYYHIQLIYLTNNYTEIPTKRPDFTHIQIEAKVSKSRTSTTLHTYYLELKTQKLTPPYNHIWEKRDTRKTLHNCIINWLLKNAGIATQ
jgi:hypothetical protein